MKNGSDSIMLALTAYHTTAGFDIISAKTFLEETK